MSEETVFVCKFLLGEQKHLPNNQLIVMKGKHHDQCRDDTAKLEYFSYVERFFPNAKLYCINLNYFPFDKYNQC